LFRKKVLAIVPAPLSTKEPDLSPQILEAQPVLTWWVRGTLLVLAVGLVAVFAIAAWIRPYDEAGDIRATYPELGLPICTFKYFTGQPCPSCGMTHSFVMLMHGDPVNSMRFNAVGTLLAVFCLALIPWSLASTYLQRPLFVLTIERPLTWIIVVFMTLVLLRWIIVLGWHAWERFS
jgi:hypothetical protein